jgi:twitching motility protein PilJ
VLARNVRSLKTAKAACCRARPALQDEVDKLLPMVDRAEKSAAVVLGQQKTLTQVGQSLRNINRQSADLLEPPRRCRRSSCSKARRRPSCRRWASW